ncbi:MAG TPA: prolyl oligopeptidase family serine peptidase [Acidobacteriota bacterium]|nr:prolyl oligopeptidase family serine peptidase [Acidobacteriota bacterium]
MKKRPVRLRLTLSLILALSVLWASVPAPVSAQAAAAAPAKKAMTVDDYAKWRTISDQALSPDGKWLVYVLELTNVLPGETKPEMHIVNLGTNKDTVVNDATGPVFSPDSRWIAYQVDPGAAQRARQARQGTGGSGNAPSGNAPSQPSPGQAQTAPGQTGQQGRRGGSEPIPPRRVELRNLAAGDVRSWEEIGQFTFAPTSSHLVLRRRGGEAEAASGRRGGGMPPQAASAREPAAASAGPRGRDAVLLDLKTGRFQLLGSVADYAFNRSGELLAYTVDAAVKDGNGLFVFDTRDGRVTPLDNDAKNYNRLAWNEEGTALAVLKGTEVEKMRERDNVLIAFPAVAAALKSGAAAPAPALLDPAKAAGFPKGWVASDRAALSWSDDGKRVFFGTKEQVPAPDATRKSTDEAANVDVWNTSDDRVQSVQMVQAERDRNFTYRAAFDVTAGRFIKLADETMRDLDVAEYGVWAVGLDRRAYLRDETVLPAGDYYRVNTATGERTLIVKGQLTGRYVFGIHPRGTHFLYWKDGTILAYDLAAGAAKTLGAGKVDFTDAEFDHPGAKPSYGVAGYTSDGKSVIVNHRYDLWLVPLDGAAPRDLTNGFGTKSEIRFRLLRVEPPDPAQPRPAAARQLFDLAKPRTLSAYGEWTKKSGYFELLNGKLKELVYEDASYGNPLRALKADVFLFTRQTFVEFPDLRVSGPGFKDTKKVSDANPQQKEFLWGRRLLFDYTNKDGKRLQGILAIPDDYKEGEKRPMIVIFYEKNSQNMHIYSAPAYLPSMGRMPVQATSDGYLAMLPDVHFRTGNSHSDMLECVEAATQKVVDLGYADPKRIGVSGHSYSGEGAAFIGTMSKMFAAVGMGAGVVDLTNDFSMPWGWGYGYQGGSGDTAFNYYLYDQGRWGFSPWDKPDKYRFESALTHVPNVTAPFLIMHGTSDPTVGFINGLAFYNALRYHNKQAVLLAYPDEGHGLRGLANRRDLTIRFFEFFDHFLKGAPAPKWWTDGVPYLKKRDGAAEK